MLKNATTSSWAFLAVIALLLAVVNVSLAARARSEGKTCTAEHPGTSFSSYRTNHCYRRLVRLLSGDNFCASADGKWSYYSCELNLCNFCGIFKHSFNLMLISGRPHFILIFINVCFEH